MAERIFMTALSPTMEEGTIGKWVKKVGESIDSGDVICEVETDKATMDYESSQVGTLLKIIIDGGASARVGETIGVIGEAGENIDELLAEIANDAPPASSGGGAPAADGGGAPASAAPAAPAAAAAAPAAAPAAPPTGERIFSSPLARRTAAEHNISLQGISGSGPRGRIVQADVQAAISSGGGRAAATSARSAAMQDSTTPVTGVRKVIAQRLAESKFSAPHFYLNVSIDMQEVIGARKLLNAQLAKQGVKVSFNAFLMKFAAEAIARHPGVNASWQNDTIVQYGSVDIGLAVDGASGLITPIVRDCLSKGVGEIDAELSGLIDKARNNRLRPEEFQGATFTISNLGSFGIESFTAIINPPGAAILAIGKTMPTPVVEPDGSIVAKNLMRVNLSCDHRVIDGAVGARFLAELKGLMENPVRLVF